jgi:hypothetical protein
MEISEVSVIFLGILSVGLSVIIYCLVKKYIFASKVYKSIDDMEYPHKNIADYIYHTKTEISKLAEYNQRNISSNELLVKKLITVLGDFDKELADIKNHLSALQDHILKKDEKIRRFEDGYDYKIQNRFIKDIFYILDGLQKSYNSNPNDITLETINDIVVMLDNNGIHEITDIKAGSIYKGQENFAYIERVESVSDASKDGLIKEITKKGFCLKAGEQVKIIKPVSVVVYKLEAKDE